MLLARFSSLDGTSSSAAFVGTLHYTDDPFNADEREAQRRAGGGPLTAPIRDHMPEQHRRFFASLRYLAVATTDTVGWPEAGLLTGPPGFVGSPDPTSLEVSSAEHGLVAGQPVGLLGIDLATRRRNRANGETAMVGPNGFGVRVQESFGNCPKYIQRRDVEPVPRVAGPTETLPSLDEALRQTVEQADTVFVASRARAGLGGVDISHRGGRPGFMEVAADQLTVPDLPGNRYYNTLGNLLGDNRAALLLVDFDRGDLLHLQGRADIDWVAQSWSLTVERAWRRRAAVPFRWSAPEFSPSLDRSGWP